MNLYQRPFQFLEHSTGPGFNSTNGSSGLYALQSTAVNRMWLQPNGRTLRVASGGSDDFYIATGSSLVAIGTTDGALVLAGTVELFRVPPAHTHVMFKSSTDVTINFTLGLGNH